MEEWVWRECLRCNLRTVHVWSKALHMWVCKVCGAFRKGE